MKIEPKRLKHYDTPGQAHALTFSCYQQRPYLSKDRTRHWFLESLESACQKHEFRLMAFVIMPEHVHLLVYPERDSYNMAKFLQSLKQPVAMKAKSWVNRHAPERIVDFTTIDSNGENRFRFWQRSGGYDRNLFSPKHIHRAIDYIHTNPVRRGLVESAGEWRWSSAGWYAEGCNGSIFDDGRHIENRHTF